MKQKLIFLFVWSLCLTHALSASEILISNPMDTLPYYQIPDAPETYSAATVAARMVDGLGYRYYWATEGLTAKDLAYEPGNNGQSCASVLKHLLGLSKMILRTLKNEVQGGRDELDMDWEDQRARTLANLKESSELLRATNDVSSLKIIFKRGDRTSEFPFWNLLNGPIADAIYHCGQIVSYRRTTGNPINPNVSVFSGKNKE